MAEVPMRLWCDVSCGRNDSNADLESMIGYFIARVAPGDRVIVFYAGHGIQEDAENYMIPVDFTATVASQIRMQGYPLSRLQHLLSHASPSLQIMIFDACRDNPFREHLSLKRGWK